MPTPKVIISYSWTTPQYQEEVLALADRLMQEGGIEVIIDEYDLKEGHDIVAYMERLKNDESLNHCLILSDAAYAKKADERKRGVGAEAQIISKEIYDSIGQTRFIPLVMEIMEDGKPYLPTFLQSRKYIDFSSPEKINQNWEKLVRLIHGKPIRVKPVVGPPPIFLEAKNGGSFTKTRVMLAQFRNALMDGKPGVAILRDDLLRNFTDELNAVHLNETDEAKTMVDPIVQWENRLRMQPEGRDLMVDWMLMESTIDAERATQKCIIPLLECVYSMTLGPETHPKKDQVIDTIKILAYEMALYAVASLINIDSATALHQLFQHPFASPVEYNPKISLQLSNFHYYSPWAQAWNSKLKPGWLSPISAKIKERATHPRISFSNLVEAEALIFIVNIINGLRWYPSSAAYCENGPRFRWFAKAKTSTFPDRLALVTGRQNWNTVRDEVIVKVQELLKGGGWTVFQWGPVEYFSAMSFVD